MNLSLPELAVYEQDWLNDQWERLDCLKQNLSLPLLWFGNMDRAARSMNVSIQLCMPLPAHILHSSTMQQVHTIRGSTDYQPGLEATTVPQWRIGYTGKLYIFSFFLLFLLFVTSPAHSFDSLCAGCQAIQRQLLVKRRVAEWLSIQEGRMFVV